VNAVLNSVSEKQYMQQIIDAAHYLGWSVYHVFDSRRSAPGFPDLVCVREGRMLAIEVKGPRGRVSDWQRYWLDLLGTVPGVTVMVAYPSDWDAVERALRGVE
jgi:hypothetical protein